MAKATTIKDALKKLEETRGVNAAEIDKVGRLQLRQHKYPQAAACTHQTLDKLHVCIRLSCMANVHQ
jgi:hypothetical protein